MKNKYKIDGDITTIYIRSKTYGDFQVLIDTEDLPKVKKASSWYVNWSIKPKSFYVVGCFIDKNGKQTRRHLHRLVLDIDDPKQLVDHINHNTLDNRKSKLRVVTSGENMQNGKIKKNNTSGFTGVSWDEKSKKWRAHIKVNRKSKDLGRFDDIEEAKLARIKAEEKYFLYKKSIKQEVLSRAGNTTKERIDA